MGITTHTNRAKWAPTHQCKVCGALWQLYKHTDGEWYWSLRSPKCGKCCDNVAMGDQIGRIKE